MKGRKPKPRALRLVQQGDRAKDSRAPQAGPFTRGMPDKPSNLDRDASDEWDRLTAALAEILSPASRGMLLCACDAYSALMAATRVLNKKGSTYRTSGESGTLIRQRPEVRMREQARRAYQQALSELGASPVAQSRVRPLPAPTRKERKERRELATYFENPTASA